MPGRGRPIVFPHNRRAFLVGALVGCASTIVGMSLMFRRNSRGILGSNMTGSIMANTKEARRPRVICFGDSLTQQGFDAERLGWLAQLAHWWSRRFDVINRGFSGYNTRWLLPLVDRIFVHGGHTPTKLVTIFLGANDCVLPGFFQHVPIEEYKQNLREMAAHVRRVHPEAKLLLITPPAIHERKWNDHRMSQSKDMDRKLEFTMSYAEACQEVGKEMSVRVVDAFAVTGSGNEALADKFFRDGVHFTAEGHKVLFQAVQQEILTFFPELNPERAVMQAPHFSEVDPVNYRESVLRGTA